MDTPIYPPAAAFERPTAISQAITITIDNFSLAELMNMPVAWAIVVKHLPALQRMTSSAMIKPHLGNFTVRTVETFVKTATPEAYVAIDDELSHLPSVQEVAP